MVLVRNIRIEKELNRKTKPWYLGPMVLLHQTTGRSYLLAELDRVVSKLCYAVFQLIPYFSRFSSIIHITELTDTNDENLNKLAEENVEQPDKEDQDSYELD